MAQRKIIVGGDGMATRHAFSESSASVAICQNRVQHGCILSHEIYASAALTFKILAV